jgi:hypothetical protein
LTVYYLVLKDQARKAMEPAVFLFFTVKR